MLHVDVCVLPNFDQCKNSNLHEVELIVDLVKMWPSFGGVCMIAGRDDIIEVHYVIAHHA